MYMLVFERTFVCMVDKKNYVSEMRPQNILNVSTRLLTNGCHLEFLLQNDLKVILPNY